MQLLALLSLVSAFVSAVACSGAKTAAPETTATEVTRRAFFDVTIGGAPAGRFVFGLYGASVPKTVENFVSLCIGDKRNHVGKPLAFTNSGFHRIIKGFMIQGGDFTRGDGTGGESIYGEKFADENFSVRHTRRGLLSMANAGPNTNGSQFFITSAATPWLDGKHVVFGEVQEGDALLEKIESLKKDRMDRPTVPVVIAKAGELTADGTEIVHSATDFENSSESEDAESVDEL